MTNDDHLRPGDVVWVDNNIVWLMTDGTPPEGAYIASYCLIDDDGRSVGDDGWFCRDANLTGSCRRRIMRNAGTDPDAIDLDAINAALVLLGLTN